MSALDGRVATDEGWEEFVREQFARINLSDVAEEDLPKGLLTNMQIAEKFRQFPEALINLLDAVASDASEETRRTQLVLLAKYIDVMVDE